MIASALLLAALAVLPSDRLAMADRLFDRGSYAEAQAEYAALRGVGGVAADELLYRLAECARMLGDTVAARAAYARLLADHPLSRHADRVRLQQALLGDESDRPAKLKSLDRDTVEVEVRAAALYHYGVAAEDAEALRRCVKLDPDGRYAAYAKFRRAVIVANDPDPAVRRTAIGELMEIHYGKDPKLACEALYMAAARSYMDRRYSEAASLFSRFLKSYAADSRAVEARTMGAWSLYLAGRYADCSALCEGVATDDASYLLAACAYASGDSARAAKLFAKYLDDWPQGRYRNAAELPLARLQFESADKNGDASAVLEAARRSASLSGKPGDRLRLGWALEKVSRDSEALAEYAAIARDFPGTAEAAEAMFRKAMSDLRAKRWSAAELSLAEALATGKLGRLKTEAAYWRGVAAIRLGHEQEGVACLTNALECGISLDQAREARLMLADIDFSAARTNEARAAYVRLIDEGACERMSASRLHLVGRFLLAGAQPAYAEARACAKALIANGGSAEWRQAGYALAGAVAEGEAEYESAIAQYRAALKEPCRTVGCAEVALRLGILESKAGEHACALKTLDEAVRLNAADPSQRARAYLWLAKTAEAMTDYDGACGYATVVVTLFEKTPEAEAARQLIASHPEVSR